MVTREEVSKEINQVFYEYYGGDSPVTDETGICLLFMGDDRSNFEEFVGDVCEIYFVSLNTDDYANDATIGKIVDDVMEQLS